MVDERRGRNGYHERMRDQIYDHVFAYPGSEVGGILVGRKLNGGDQIITGAIPAESTEGNLVSLTFTHASWEQIHNEISKSFPDEEIVGWYHSHPGHGIFLSNHDAFIHHNFFSDPACIALVVDPLNGEEGMFGWNEKSLECFWHQATHREPVPGVAPPKLVDGGDTDAVATVSSVGFEGQPTYDNEILDASKLFAGEPEPPQPTNRRSIDVDSFADIEVRSPATLEKVGYSLAAYLVPAIFGSVFGVLLALLLSSSTGTS